MRSISARLAIALVIVVVGAYANAAVGAQAPAQAQDDRTFQGTLVKVDTDMHMLTVKAADAKEWVFSYTDDTKVIGPARDVQGLTGKPGAMLKVTFHIEGLANRATRIEVAR
jgi:hypothetical protein